MRAFLFCLLFLVLQTPVWGQEVDPGQDEALFRSAVVQLGQGEEQKALGNLNRIGEDSFGSFYNKGLAYRNLGDLPRARAYFEKALIVSPRSLATRRRLRELRGRMDSEMPQLDTRWTPWWSQSEAEVLLLLPILALFAMAILRRRERQVPRSATAGTVVLALGLGLAFWLTNPPAHRAVVVEGSAQLLPAPESGKSGSPLMAGQMVEVLDSRKHFLEIRLGDGRQGWVRAAKLELLSRSATNSQKKS